MRIALLYSGLPRMWRECHATQMALFPGADIDVYFHFWDTVDAAEKCAIVETMKPAAYLFEPPRDFGAVDRYPWLKPDNINVPSRLISQYVSWRQVATLFQPFAPGYGLAVRTRSDLFFFDKIKYDLANVASGGISLVGYLWPEMPSLLSDMFAIGKPRAIVHYLSLIDFVWRYALTDFFNAETLITRHISTMVNAGQKSFVYVMRESPFFVFRPHMAGWTPEQCRSEGPGISKWRDPEIVAEHKRYHGQKQGPEGEAMVDAFARHQLNLAASKST